MKSLYDLFLRFFGIGTSGDLSGAVNCHSRAHLSRKRLTVLSGE